MRSYVPAPGVLLARRQNPGFSGPGGFHADSACDFPREPRLQRIPHSASVLTLEYVIEGTGVQSLDDESWAIDNLRVELANDAAPLDARLTNFKAAYPVGTVPRFTAILHGAATLATATLQSSKDLGIKDAWEDLVSLPVNVNGSASFLNVPGPGADKSEPNFYRVKIDEPGAE